MPQLKNENEALEEDWESKDKKKKTKAVHHSGGLRAKKKETVSEVKRTTPCPTVTTWSHKRTRKTEAAVPDCTVKQSHSTEGVHKTMQQK